MSTPRVRFSHVGIHVHEMGKMVAFYTGLLGLRITDRGRLPLPGDPEIVFLSRDPAEHHQIALVEGRKDGGIPSGVLNQLSFSLDSLDDLRELGAAAEGAGVKEFLPLNHGNAWSLYFADPEGNVIEAFVESPWYVPQPQGSGLDLSKSEAEIRADTLARYRDTPGFRPIEEWREAFAKELESGQSRTR